jgi:predicted DNA-binding transcriptional regulator YafY
MLADKFVRMFGTIVLLKVKQLVSAQELANRFRVGLRTVYRDIDEIQSIGICIDSSTGPDGGYKLKNDVEIHPFLFADKDALALYLLGVTSQELPKDLEYQVKSIVEEAKTLIRPEDNMLMQLIKSRVYFDTSDWYWKSEAASHLASVKTALFFQRIIKIHYKERRSEELQQSSVCPYGLAWKGGEWYLVGKLKESETIRRFRLNRISEITETLQQFEFPKKFVLRNWWNHEMEEFGKGTIKVVLVAAPEAREEIERLATKNNSTIVRRDELTYVTLFVDKWQWLVPFVLSYSDSVCVKEPQALQEAVVTSLKNTLGLYCGRHTKGKHLKFFNDDSRLRATHGRFH